MDPTPKSVLGLESYLILPRGKTPLATALALPFTLQDGNNRFLWHGSCTDKHRQTAARGVQPMTRWMTLDRKVKIAKGEDAHFNDLGEKKASLYPRETMD